MFQRGHKNFKEIEKDMKNMAVLEGNIVGAKPRVLFPISLTEILTKKQAGQQIIAALACFALLNCAIALPNSY
ncbi:MAG: hypothetical protein LBV08_06770 [Clostridiales bacterium]|jgi:phosphotransferase system  glucose/maltose/N-acetylglucosamine-specific IIC component|nr:hypothetical protein [Clostridiales bacterium]